MDIQIDFYFKMYHNETRLRVCYLSPLTIGGLHFSLVVPVVARRPPLTLRREIKINVEIACASPVMRLALLIDLKLSF